MFAPVCPKRAFQVFLGILLFRVTPAQSQTVTSFENPATPTVAGVSSAATPKTASPDGPLTGLNFTVNENLQHDSSTAWSDILTPDLSLQLNPHLSVDASLPWYLSLAAYVPSTVKGVTTTALTQVQNLVGDTALAAHASGSHGDFNFSGGAVAGLATGDKSLGIGAGQTTYHLGTHAEYSVGPLTPDVEAGIGNSSAFANHVVRKSYTAVGEIANFQAGTSIDLPKKLSLDLEAYEAMPVQLATVFGTIGRRGNHAHGGGKKTVQGAATSAEDNGFTLDLSFPITYKLTLSADWEHSLIQAEDIAGFSLTWTLRTPKRNEDAIRASPLSHTGY